jgi:hypothetical protein
MFDNVFANELFVVVSTSTIHSVSVETIGLVLFFAQPTDKIIAKIINDTGFSFGVMLLFRKVFLFIAQSINFKNHRD